jgi:CTP:molybdopterin cytidylyltransferase MocA
VVEIYLRGVELAIRGGTPSPPAGPHALVGRAGDLAALLAHVERRADCRALAVVGDARAEVPRRDGLRLLVTGTGDSEELAAWLLPVPAIVLAAGAGSRIGGDKMLRPLGGRPLVRWALEAAREGGADGVYAVYADERVRDVLGEGVNPVFNPDAAQGQATSLAAGLRALPEPAAAAVVLLGDQPLVGAATVRTLLRAWRSPRAAPAVAASYGAGWLPPVVLDRALWPRALALQGDQGARAIFRQHPELVEAVPVPGRPDDADTQDDLGRIAGLLEADGCRQSRLE